MDVTIILQIAQYASAITGTIGAVVLLVKPLRDWVTGANRLRDGQKCLLRNNMLHTYYKHRENRTIRQYEYENFEMEYKAYKALKGNSFIDRIYSEIKEYEIVS